MILIIQTCLIFLFFVFAWCEFTPVFKDSLFKVCTNNILAVSCLALSYYSTALLTLPYIIQFCALLGILVVTMLVVKWILGQYLKRKCNVKHKN